MPSVLANLTSYAFAALVILWIIGSLVMLEQGRRRLLGSTCRTFGLWLYVLLMAMVVLSRSTGLLWAAGAVAMFAGAWMNHRAGQSASHPSDRTARRLIPVATAILIAAGWAGFSRYGFHDGSGAQIATIGSSSVSDVQSSAESSAVALNGDPAPADSASNFGRQLAAQSSTNVAGIVGLTTLVVFLAGFVMLARRFSV